MKKVTFLPGLLVMFILTWMSCVNKNESSLSNFDAGDVITDHPIDMEMVFIPAGTFIMGADHSADDEDPAHEVTLAAYFIGKTVVTQKEWETVMGSNPSEPIGADFPVVNVSWEDAQEFVKRLSEQTGQTYRLPTEAEWEYACRAGSTTRFYFGEDTLQLGDHGWYRSNSGMKLHPVAQKKPNGWGLYDMVGNTWEWCEDWWDPDFYERSDQKNPINRKPYLYKSPTSGDEFTVHVARSGAYGHPPSAHESAHRHGARPGTARPMVSFRCVREI